MRKNRFLILLIIIILIIVYKYGFYQRIDEHLTDIKKCPSCYGTSCKIIHNGELNLISYSTSKFFNAFLNVKNVFYAKYGLSNLVLKKLAHTNELVEHDAKLCNAVGYPLNCDVSMAVTTLVRNFNYQLNLIIAMNEELFGNSEVLKCHHQRPIDLLYSKFRSSHWDEQSLEYFITLLAVNPEPLIMETFSDVIPVPRVLDTCGRLIVEEFAGKTLSYFYDEPWLIRANLSLQLLRMAEAMTDHEVRIYLTDPTPDNFAVDQRGLLKLIDVENVVLVDSLEKNIEHSIHFNSGIGCIDCFSYDYEDLCYNSKSDHNYFAVCKGLLSSNPFSSALPGGLLHTIPEAILGKAPSIRFYIEECARPRHTSNRIQPAASLSRLLTQLVS